MSGKHDYCFNCGHHELLPDGTFCDWCLNFFRDHGRMSVPADADNEPEPEIDRVLRLFDKVKSLR